MDTNKIIFGAIFLIVIVIMVRLSSGKPVKPRLFTQYSDGRTLEWDHLGEDVNQEAKIRLRSPRLFYRGDPNDQDGINYEDMTPQERYDAGFR